MPKCVVFWQRMDRRNPPALVVFWQRVYSRIPAARLVLDFRYPPACVVFWQHVRFTNFPAPGVLAARGLQKESSMVRVLAARRTQKGPRERCVWQRLEFKSARVCLVLRHHCSSEIAERASCPGSM